ncbi:hypothetical protein HD806DRAFT_479441 [Xylariaceae sp. AK1471]|nr:hypothetical protein HD806DRAFT_479441 [Xylariaceae sp. AK1471]
MLYSLTGLLIMSNEPAIATHLVYHLCKTVIQWPVAAGARIFCRHPDPYYPDLLNNGDTEIPARDPQKVWEIGNIWMMKVSSQASRLRPSSVDNNGENFSIIDQDNVAAEVRVLEAGSALDENKYIEVDDTQPSQDVAKLNNEQWQALIALHWALLHEHHDFFLPSQRRSAYPTILHEHHDFFLASRYPFECPGLSRRADKLAMSVGMWGHRIHSFLILLKYGISRLFDHTFTSIYLAYSMMAFLYALDDTRIECLGGLSGYGCGLRASGRGIWNPVSRHQDPQAWNKAPTLERLCHELASCGCWWRAEAGCEAASSVLSFRTKAPHRKSTESKQLKGLDAILVRVSGVVWRFGFGCCWVLNQSILSLCRCFQRPARHHALCFISFFVSAASASVMPNSVDRTPETGQSMTTNYQSDGNGLSWPWYPAIVTGILAGEFAAVHILREPLLFHGISMGISAGAFLLMAFNHEVPFHLQFSTWIICAILTIVWIHHDTLDLRQESRQVAVLCVIVGGVLLDIGISSAFTSSGSSMFATNDSPSAAFLLASFLLPCISMSAFLCRGIRGLYRQVTSNVG